MVGGAVATATVRAVKNRRLIPTRAALVLTQAAVQRVKELLKDRPDAVGLRVGVRQRGCNGLSYTLDFVQEKKKFDEEVLQDGACVIVDAKAQLTLLGTEMDYVCVIVILLLLCTFFTVRFNSVKEWF
uniref:Iron-sulfur cluster assembly 1 homolog, mitochondrial n=1 Tax=Hirondellea gigas TaxID=1518452 RepID=A0A6A7FQ45_9CRUS